MPHPIIPTKGLTRRSKWLDQVRIPVLRPVGGTVFGIYHEVHDLAGLIVNRMKSLTVLQTII